MPSATGCSAILSPAVSLLIQSTCRAENVPPPPAQVPQTRLRRRHLQGVPQRCSGVLSYWRATAAIQNSRGNLRHSRQTVRMRPELFFIIFQRSGIAFSFSCTTFSTCRFLIYSPAAYQAGYSFFKYPFSKCAQFPERCRQLHDVGVNDVKKSCQRCIFYPK